MKSRTIPLPLAVVVMFIPVGLVANANARLGEAQRAEQEQRLILNAVAGEASRLLQSTRHLQSLLPGEAWYG